MNENFHLLAKLINPSEDKLNILLLESSHYLPSISKLCPQAEIHLVTIDYGKIMAAQSKHPAEGKGPKHKNPKDMPQLHWHYLDYRQDELAEVFPENCFDYIVAEECFVGVKDTEKLTDKLWLLLKETGCFLTSCYNARYVDLIQQEAAGNFGAYARGIFTREEIRGLFNSIYYKSVETKGVQANCPPEKIQALQAAGFDQQELAIAVWLIMAYREDSNVRQLKSLLDTEKREQFGRLLRRIEGGISVQSNTLKLCHMQAKYAIPPVYTALFIRLITTSPLQLLKQLLPALKSQGQQAMADDLLENLAKMYKPEIFQEISDKLATMQDRAPDVPWRLTAGETEDFAAECAPEKKIAFITCINDQAMYAESLQYLRNLYIPEDMAVEIIPMEGCSSMASAYNAAMKQTNARYKVYLHQDTYIVNRNFIYDILQIFQDAKIGVIGMAGAKQLPATGIWWNAPAKYGAVLHWQEAECIIPTLHQNPEPGTVQRVETADGFLLATQYDIPWREDICDGWHMYDICQCKDMARHGFETVIPHQETYWCIHRPAPKPLDPLYEKYRRRFIQEYAEEMLVFKN